MTLNHSQLMENPSSNEIGVSRQNHADSTPTNPPETSRIYARASLVRARAFCRMSNQEQRRFIAHRFQQLDPQELVNIFRALYGHPADKGRPRSKGE